MAYQSLHQMNLYDVLGDNPWAQDDDFMKDRDYMKKCIRRWTGKWSGG